MDDFRNRLIEEQFPEGKAETGFHYSFDILDQPKDTVALELRIPDQTLRLFFNPTEFRDFMRVATYTLSKLPE